MSVSKRKYELKLYDKNRKSHWKVCENDGELERNYEQVQT